MQFLTALEESSGDFLAYDFSKHFVTKKVTNILKISKIMQDNNTSKI